MPPHVEKEQEQQGSSDNTTLIYLVVRNRETSGGGTIQGRPMDATTLGAEAENGQLEMKTMKTPTSAA